MINSNLESDLIKDYITMLIRHEDSNLMEIETYAKKHLIPIIEPEVARLLQVLVRIHKPKRILEIGTAIGYSALILAGIAKEYGGCIHTMEKDEEMIRIARENIEKSGYEDIVTVFKGDGKYDLVGLKPGYDMIFIDGAKGHYKIFFEACMKLISVGGLLVFDNVLFKGMIASDKLVKRRKITIVKRMRSFIEEVVNNPLLESMVLPISDGVLVSYVKENNLEVR